LFFTRSPLAPIQGLTKTYFAKGTAADGTEQQVLTIENMPVFRSGTFRDSTGWQTTWEALHIQEMVRHFQYLIERGIFEDVPVRAGHPSFLGMNPIHEVIGYHTALRSEKRHSSVHDTEFEYLLADYVILDADAAAKINSGLWRNRSSEIGTYVDNSEAEYAPTYMGVAYVDIPAVESLNSFAKNTTSDFGIMMEEEMSGLPKPTPPAPAPANGPGTAPAPAPAADDNAQFSGAPTPQPNFAFSINGTATTDFAAVQAHVTELETANKALTEFQANTLKTQREDFVKGLAAENKIGADQIDAFNAFAAGLDAAQFTAWSGTFSNAAPQAILQNHGSQTPVGTDANANSGQEPQVEEFARHKGVIRGLHRARISADKIKRTAEYKALVQADKDFDLDAFLAAK
jgi:hypothetical protein